MTGLGARVRTDSIEADHPHLVLAARDYLVRIGDDLVDTFLTHWPPASAARRSITPSSLPVLAWLPAAVRVAAAASAEIALSLEAAAGGLKWRQTYTARDVSHEFLQNYGYTELVGERGPVPSAVLGCGFLLLGPGVEYPAHSHDAEEIYVPLTDSTLWKAGTGGWVKRPVGRPIHHVSRLSHGMRTLTMPLLALYLWRGGDLQQKSALD